MLDFNMEYLRTFYYVASLKSISKAADALYITQPACTQTIKKLENYMGTELFYRKSRSTELTPAGALLFKHVRQGFHAFLNGEKELVRSKEHSAGTLSISATETPLFSVILPMLSTVQGTTSGSENTSVRRRQHSCKSETSAKRRSRSRHRSNTFSVSR